MVHHKREKDIDCHWNNKRSLIKTKEQMPPKPKVLATQKQDSDNDL